MHSARRNRWSGERGSALVIAILIVVILALLGVSFLLMADTENRIAENEKLSAQALYFGESGVRMVKRWFDSPGSTANLLNPPISIINRGERVFDADGDLTTELDQTPADGSAALPYYKQGIDLNGDGADDVFDRPYRQSAYHSLLGIPDQPDMRIDWDYSTAAKTFLTNLSNRLLQGFPAAAAGVRARITRIDVYAPPYVNVGGAWTRYGMATVEVTAQIYRIKDSDDVTLAEKKIRAVLNETPYPGPFGPLHSCQELVFSGYFLPHWGAVTSVGDLDLPNALDLKVDDSVPRDVPGAARVDTLWGSDLSVNPNFVDYKNSVEASGFTIEDPWLRYMTGGSFVGPGAPGAGTQPLPFVWNPPYPAALTDADDHSNLFQNLAILQCPNFEYETWKTIATSGGENVHYYRWSNGSSFQENGIGTARTLESILDDETGLFFFDTQDAMPPRDDDGDGLFDNLTPQVQISAATWGTRGFIYLNTERFVSKGVTGRPAVYRAPGEPFLDLDADAQYDAGEPYLNLVYPTTLGGAFTTTTVDNGRDGAGPAINDVAVIWGVLYTNGFFDAAGSAKYYGSVISKEGVVAMPAAGNPDLYWDESILTEWPPAAWNLPRTVITRWDTDL